MRRKRDPQLDIEQVRTRHQIAREFEAISEVLDACPEMLDWVHEDLAVGICTNRGRQGMTAEQVLRSALVKQIQGFTYEELAFHLSDSQTVRAFTRMGMDQNPSASTLHQNIGAIREQTWERINRRILQVAKEAGVETGRKMRVDTTAVETDIHEPTDSSLLWDAVRVLTRYLWEGKGLLRTPGYAFSDHTRAAKRRAREIQTAKRAVERKRKYRELVRLAEQVRGYSMEAIEELRGPWQGQAMNAKEARKGLELARKMEEMLGRLDRVVSQTERRVFEGESVPAPEKIVSVFEPHTDILAKKNRKVEYGHKVCVAAGESGLVTDVMVCQGNPADSDLFVPMLERHMDIYGEAPKQTAADGGFASKANLAAAKGKGVEDVCFAKRRGLNVADMVRNSRVYRVLRGFRAAMEAVLSVLKRAYALRRCTWSGWSGFLRYVWSVVVGSNLVKLARLRLADA